ncbi:MAG TPA: hypothetical protein VH062_20465 [Polyangiaceae bacterium]|nr:hypothetical protein [Polyangiaceae bacterium]
MDELWRPGLPRFRFWENLEARVILRERFELERPAMPPHWLEWYRFRPKPTCVDPFVDAARAMVLIDTLGWPAVSLRHPDSRFRAPSLDVVTFFHSPATSSEWLLCEQECPQGRHGLLSPRARVFDRDGKLVASGGAQLLCIPVPSG